MCLQLGVNVIVLISEGRDPEKVYAQLTKAQMGECKV